jgi:hypothetical protein
MKYVRPLRSDREKFHLGNHTEDSLWLEKSCENDLGNENIYNHVPSAQKSRN